MCNIKFLLVDTIKWLSRTFKEKRIIPGLKYPVELTTMKGKDSFIYWQLRHEDGKVQTSFTSRWR